MSEVAFAKLFAVYVIVDIDGLLSHVPPKLLDEFAWHPRPSEVGGEPVAATVRREMILHPIRVGIMQTNLGGYLFDQPADSATLDSLAAVVDEEGLRSIPISRLSHPQPLKTLKNENGFFSILPDQTTRISAGLSGRSVLRTDIRFPISSSVRWFFIALASSAARITRNLPKSSVR